MQSAGHHGHMDSDQGLSSDVINFFNRVVDQVGSGEGHDIFQGHDMPGGDNAQHHDDDDSNDEDDDDDSMSVTSSGVRRTSSSSSGSASKHSASGSLTPRRRKRVSFPATRTQPRHTHTHAHTHTFTFPHTHSHAHTHTHTQARSICCSIIIRCSIRYVHEPVYGNLTHAPALRALSLKANFKRNNSELT